MLTGNAVIGQSGGPTAAINATLSGVMKGAFSCPQIQKVYGMRHGINGLIDQNMAELQEMDEASYHVLETTPAAALGSCRRKLPEPGDKNVFIMEEIFRVFEKYDIRYFFYIGGNDSMDTVDKLARYAKKIGYEIQLMGVPKTIDNDLVGTDHTPGFGSAAKYIATTMQEIARDCAVYQVKAVTIVEVMGRDAGWLTAAAGLPRLMGNDTADLIYLPEQVFDYTAFVESVKGKLAQKPNVVVAVSEGICDREGRYVGEGLQSGAVDIFGHKYLAGTARVLEGFVKEQLGCKVRAVELSLPQRCAGHCLSATDIAESVMIGKEAVRHAVSAVPASGNIAVFRRRSRPEYEIEVGVTEVCRVANQISRVGQEYLAQDNVTDALLERILPLIQGEVEIPRKGGLPVHFKL